MSELADSFRIARAALDSLENDFAAGRVDAEQARPVLVNVIAALRIRDGRFKPTRKAGNKNRGIRFNDDELQIIASLPEHDGSLSKAAKAYWGEPVDLDSRMRKLRRIVKRIKKGCSDPAVFVRTLIAGN